MFTRIRPCSFHLQPLPAAAAALALLATSAPGQSADPLSPAGTPDLRPPSLAERVLFDEPGDGTLWARGGLGYKARFDPEGVTYFPRFGPEAPQLFPLRLSLERVLLGDEELAFERGVDCQREGSTVSYPRGSLVELYDVRPDGLEQLFRFESLPRGGELVVQVALETELAVFSSAAGLELSNEHGRLGYSRAVVIDDRGERQELSTSLVDRQILIRVPAAFLEGAVFPITIDPVISTFDVNVDAATNDSNADVAYDESTDRYAVSWEEIYSSTDSDVYCSLWTSDGVLVPNSEVIIDVTTDSWSNPAIANDQTSDQFLVVAQTRLGPPESQRIEGRTRQAAGNTLGSQFLISGANDFGYAILPDVGGHPESHSTGRYCVVWQRNRTSTETDIRYQIVLSDSTLLHSGSQSVDTSNGTLDVFPSISKSCGRGPHLGQRWTVVWQRRASTTNEDIYGAQIAPIGQIVASTFVVDASHWNDTKPQVSSVVNGWPLEREYMVVWQRGGTYARDIHARIMQFNQPLTPSVNLTALEGVDVGEDQIQPAVDCDGSRFAVVYSESVGNSTANYHTFVSTFDVLVGAAQIVLNEAHQPLGTSIDGEFDARIVSTQSGTEGIASHERRFMAVWQDLDYPGTLDGDIEGALYQAVGSVGVPYCFGDGGMGQSCPCDNPGGPGVGCRNSTGVGAELIAAGSNKIGEGTLVLRALHALPNQPGLFFQGELPLNSGAGFTFGDGLRCCGFHVVRLEVSYPSATGVCQTTVDIEAAGNASYGDTKCYQFWYRNPVGSPCGSTFNLTNGYEITWIF